MSNIDFKSYSKFVETLTSEPSKKMDVLSARLYGLQANVNGETEQHGPHLNIPLFMTSAMGMCSESGEFMEIVKKCIWQGKELNDDVVFHLKRELGDVIFYWTQACISLGYDPNEVIAENVRKLEARYPGGKFNVYHSENRQEGDL